MGDQTVQVGEIVEVFPSKWEGMPSQWMHTSSRFFTSHPDKLHNVIRQLRQDGPSKLKIVSDFDYTMTKAWVGADSTTRGLSCHKILEDCGYLSDEYHVIAQGFQAKYFPIENDPYMPIPEKASYMKQWAEEANKLLTDSGLSLSTIKRAVEWALSEHRCELRSQLNEFFSILGDHRVPILIFSAGIKDVLAEVLRKSFSIVETPRCYIVSNQCIFRHENEGGTETSPIEGFKPPTIHVFNKKTSTFLDCDFFKEPDEPSRHNVILVGDSVGDLLMIEGMTYQDDNHVLKIGFLNVNAEERLKQYCDLYDIVITGNDSSFELPYFLVKYICSN